MTAIGAIWYSEHSEDELRQRHKSATDRDAPDHMRGESFERWAEAEGYIKAVPFSIEPIAWFRMENGIRVYYETEAWPNMTPLYTAPSATAVSKADAELANIVNAERFNRERFRDDTEFADWAQSRCRHAIDRKDAA